MPDNKHEQQDITVSFNKDEFDFISIIAKNKNVSIANFIKEFTIKSLLNKEFENDDNQEDINELTNPELLKDLTEGLEDARHNRGRYV